MKSVDPLWESICEKILDSLDYYLVVIEQRYGDCRAPFAWPPVFHVRRRLFGRPVYRCEIPMDNDLPSFIIESENPQDLPDKVNRAVRGRFGNVAPE